MAWWACSSRAFGSAQSWLGNTMLQLEMLWLSFGHIWLRLAISTIHRTCQEQVCHASSTKRRWSLESYTQSSCLPTASTHRIHHLHKITHSKCCGEARLPCIDYFLSWQYELTSNCAYININPNSFVDRPFRGRSWKQGVEGPSNIFDNYDHLPDAFNYYGLRHLFWLSG